MNITIVNKHREDVLGGSELQCDFIATELVKREHNVKYIAPKGNKEVYDAQYEVITCENKGFEISKKIIESRPNIVYWRYNKHHLYSVMSSLKKEGLPVVFAASSVNDVNPWFGKKKSRLRSFIKNLVKSHWNHFGIKMANAVTVNNPEYLKMLPVAKQYYIPNGMISDYKDFEWKKPYCAWVSNIKQIKRPEKLIELAKMFLKEDIDFIMVGDIQERDYHWIHDVKSLADNVHYLGIKTPEEVNGIFKSALMHIHTCYPEGFPNVFIQSWMQGTPSVSLGFDPGGYLESEEMGYSANENMHEFRKFVDLLIGNDILRKQLGDNASRFAHDMFRIEKAVDKLEVIFSEMNDLKINGTN